MSMTLTDLRSQVLAGTVTVPQMPTEPLWREVRRDVLACRTFWHSGPCTTVYYSDGTIMHTYTGVRH